jgi:hypothetical protein
MHVRVEASRSASGHEDIKALPRFLGGEVERPAIRPIIPWGLVTERRIVAESAELS